MLLLRCKPYFYALRVRVFNVHKNMNKHWKLILLFFFPARLRASIKRDNYEWRGGKNELISRAQVAQTIPIITRLRRRGRLIRF